MTSGPGDLDLRSAHDGDAFQQAVAEIDRLRRRVAVLESDLAASISDRSVSLAELSIALFEERGRLAAATQQLDEMTAREDELLRRQEAVLRERALLDVEISQLAERQRNVEQARKAASQAQLAANLAQAAAERAKQNADLELHHAQSSLTWRVASRLHGILSRHPALARLSRRALLAAWWTASGQLAVRLRDRRRQIASARNAMLPATYVPAALVATDTALLPAPSPEVSSPLSSSPRQLPERRGLTLIPATGLRPPPPNLAHPREGPLVSVIVTSFNYGRSVTRAVDSVLAQTFKNLEVIVVEGGSPEIHSRLTVARLNRPRTRVLMQGEPHCAGANRNYGISQARGKYICCLDADDALAPTFIEKAVFLAERQAYDVVGCALRLLGREMGAVFVQEAPDLAMLLDSNHMLTCALFRKTYWELAGGYRDVDKAVSGHIHEDWAFWIRLAALGARFYNLYNDPLLLYTVHNASLSRSSDVMPMWQQRQMVRLMNTDVIEPLTETVAFSQRRKNIRLGTPALLPQPIEVAADVHGPNQPTILLALPFMLLGGAERLLCDVIGDLAGRGWRVVIVTSTPPPPNGGDTIGWFAKHTQEIFRLTDGMPPKAWESFLHHLVRSRRVDILWIAGSTLAYDAVEGLRAARPGLRVVDLLFNVVGHTANNRRRRAAIDLNFVESDQVGDWLLAHGEEPERISIVRSGVDTAALSPRPRSEGLVHQLGLASDELIVGFCGRWSEEKNPLGFIALAGLVDLGLPVRFVMTGTGPLRPQMEAAILEAQLPAGRIRLLGEVEDIASVLGSLDLLVVPSILDGRPVVVLEALSLGVPVLAASVGALPELIEDGRTGWICEPGDDAAFAKRIEDAARNPKWLAQMRKEARAYAEAHLDRANMLTAYHDALRSLLPKGRSHA